jgi:hypothetical protein
MYIRRSCMLFTPLVFTIVFLYLCHYNFYLYKSNNVLGDRGCGSLRAADHRNAGSAATNHAHRQGRGLSAHAAAAEDRRVRGRGARCGTRYTVNGRGGCTARLRKDNDTDQRCSGDVIESQYE